jgi:hypothetical protein
MAYYECNLRHWHPHAKDIFITWRLHGSLPASIQLPNASGASRTEGERFRALDRVLDRGRSGRLWLKDDRVAGCVMAALQTGGAKHLFHLHAFVVMANTFGRMSPSITGFVTLQNGLAYACTSSKTL